MHIEDSKEDNLNSSQIPINVISVKKVAHNIFILSLLRICMEEQNIKPITIPKNDDITKCLINIKKEDPCIVSSRPIIIVKNTMHNKLLRAIVGSNAETRGPFALVSLTIARLAAGAVVAPVIPNNIERDIDFVIKKIIVHIMRKFIHISEKERIIVSFNSLSLICRAIEIAINPKAIEFIGESS
jgi:hypothetical protein